jgi:hypothetical protein
MATFTITFRGAQQADEEVSADVFVDSPPFVDFKVFDRPSGEDRTVARYRQEEIRKITRED